MYSALSALHKSSEQRVIVNRVNFDFVDTSAFNPNRIVIRALNASSSFAIFVLLNSNVACKLK